MPHVTTHAITDLRDHIYDEASSAGITAVTRSGRFAGVFITPGALEPQLAARFHEVVRRNPKHGIQLLIDYITPDA